MDAAERLFLSRGYEQTSVRQIAAAAGVGNIGAVSYYYGGKEALLSAVLERVWGPVTTARLQRLEELERSGTSSLEAILDAFVRPLVQLGHGSRRIQMAQLAAFFLESPGTGKSAWTTISPTSFHPDDRVRDAIRAALPGLGTDELEWRFQAMLGVLFVFLIGTMDELSGFGEDQEDTICQRLVAAAIGIWGAPVSWGAAS